MKKLFIVLTVAISSLLIAQEQVLVGGSVTHGGFGGPVVKLSQFDGDLGVMVGGRGGWIIGHTVTLGGGGYGLANDIPLLYSDSDTTKYLNMGYGGFEIGFILSSNKVMHFTVNSLIGGGSVGYRKSVFDEDHHDEDHNWDYDYDYDYNHDPIFVIEPSVNMVLNVTQWFRVGMGASYRYVTGVNLEPIDNDFVSGPSAVLSLKFGKF